MDFSADLNPCTSDNTHEEVGYQACNCHHEALHNRHLSEEREDKIDEVDEAWVQKCHVVDDAARNKSDEEEERNR